MQKALALTPTARSFDRSAIGRAAGMSLIWRAAATPTLRAYQPALWAAGITLVLSTVVIGQAHADPKFKVQPQYVKPVFPPGPPPCIQCGQQLRPNPGSNLVVNPQINGVANGPQASFNALRR